MSASAPVCASAHRERKRGTTPAGRHPGARGLDANCVCTIGLRANIGGAAPRAFTAAGPVAHVRNGEADYRDVQRVPSHYRVVLVALIAFALGVVAPVAAQPTDELEVVRLLNAARVAAGLGEVSLSGDLSSFAREHTATMAARGTIFHSAPRVRLARAPAGWLAMGENVGMGSGAGRLHELFMQSPSHRQNILGDYDYVGVGADRGRDGRLYVTMVFLKTRVPGAAVARNGLRAAAPASSW